MPNCWLWGGQNSRKLSTSTRRSFFSSSPKFSTWFCRSSMETRQPSDSPLPSLSIFHMMRAASLVRREPRAPCTSRASYVLLQNKDKDGGTPKFILGVGTGQVLHRLAGGWPHPGVLKGRKVWGFSVASLFSSEVLQAPFLWGFLLFSYQDMNLNQCILEASWRPTLLTASLLFPTS